MTIEEVMSRILAWQKSKPGDICHSWNYVRDALQVLVAQARDEEAEACAEVCENLWSKSFCVASIRARIAARKVAP